MQNKTQKQTKQYPAVLWIMHQIPHDIQWYENNNKQKQYSVICGVSNQMALSNETTTKKIIKTSRYTFSSKGTV